MSTRTAQEGDYVYLRTASPITDGNRIVVPVGSYVQGVVGHVQRSGRVKGRAALGIRLETLTLPRGKVVRFSPRLDSLDPNETGQQVDRGQEVVRQAPGVGGDTAQIVILAGSGAALGGIADRGWEGAGIGAGVGAGVGIATVLLTRGRPVELRRGSTLDVAFDRAVELR
ncbi:MAG: hypothetical protein ACM3S5_00285 [Rhodospirillales bacterium]